MVNSPTREDALLDVYLVWPENSLIFCNIVQGISDHCGVLLEVEWGETCQEPQVEGWFLFSTKQMFRLAGLLTGKILMMGSKW